MKIRIDKNMSCARFREIMECRNDTSSGSAIRFYNRNGSLIEENGYYDYILYFLFYTNKTDVLNHFKDIDKPTKQELQNALIKFDKEVVANEKREYFALNWSEDQVKSMVNCDKKNPLATTFSTYLKRDCEENPKKIFLNPDTETEIFLNSILNVITEIDGRDSISQRCKKWIEKLEFNDEEIKKRFENFIFGDDVHEAEEFIFNKFICAFTAFTFTDGDLPDYKIDFKPTTSYCGMQLYLENMIMAGKKQIILTGAPGTGKTHMAKNIAEELGTELFWENEEDKQKKYEFVQFHPSYDYTDFVEGLRPIEIDGEICFKKMDGIFKRFCRWVAYQNNEDKESSRKKGEKREEKKYFFIIDEINRADLSKVFGELMYCLEGDKRGKEHSIETQYQNLDTYFEESLTDIFSVPNRIGNEKEAKKNYIKKKFGDEAIFPNGFYIPENVIVIGTMNDIDRSVESMDFAMRRRFTWKEVEVNEGFLKSTFNAMLPGKVKIDPEELAKRIMQLNYKFKERNDLNRHFYISQGQLSDIINTMPANETIDELLCEAWNNNIKMLIAEYVRGEEDAQQFLNGCEDIFLRQTPSAKDS